MLKVTILAAMPGATRGLLFATVVVWFFLEARQATRRRVDATTADRGSRPVLRIASMVGAGGAIVMSHAVPGAIIASPTTTAWAGLVVLWCGVALRVWSFHALGQYFTFTVQTSRDQPVVTDGPYRFVRHPSYAAILLAVVGIGVLINNWAALAVLTGAVACGLVFRIRIEERALLQDLGDRYGQYAAAHKRLIPYVW
jgi:protein-S-isoprenylcysteine O-methyltransferase Ste14